MQKREYKISVTVITEQDGDYRNPAMKKILNTGFMNVDDALIKVNEAINKKLGLEERLEVVRDHGLSRSHS